MFVRRKQSIACAGVCTIGSFSLNDVLRQNGHAGQLAEPLQQLPVQRIHVPLHGLQPAGAVLVRDRRNPLALLRLDLVRLHHERRRVVGLEILAGGFRQHRRTERAERLAELDAAVENVLHVLAARIGQDAAVPERARSELHPALEPADDLAVGDRVAVRATSSSSSSL